MITNKFNIALVDDEIVFRKAISEIINIEDNIVVYEDFENCDLAIKKGDIKNWDLLLLDISFPDEKKGFEFIRKFKEIKSSLIILMLTTFDEEDYIIESLCLGADGYILKKESDGQIVKMINDAINGGAYITPAISRRIINLFSINNKIKLPSNKIELLELAGEGYTYKEIGKKKNISEDGVKNHFREIFNILGVNDKTAAYSYAIKNRLIKWWKNR